MPGSGKSTIGKRLAAKLSLPFYDLDHLIEQKTSSSISNFFKEQGESAFRLLEAETLSEVISSHDQGVISTGGGTPCYYSGIERMKEAGVVFFLDVPLDVLRSRVAKSSDRPLLENNSDDLLMELYQKRRPVYERASFHIDCGNEEVDSVVNKLLKCLN